jgi:hypothetical protein
VASRKHASQAPAEVTFSLAFDGPALHNDRIDARIFVT